MKLSNPNYEKNETTRKRRKTRMSAVLLGLLLVSSVSIVEAQVYGVARRTTVVSGPNRTVVASKKTVVAGGAALPRGYIATLPRGYRAVYVSGVRYYTIGGVYYRPHIYGGRTVYVTVRL